MMDPNRHKHHIMEFDCRRISGSCVTGAICFPENGTCGECLPGWAHSRGVVWNDDCMTPPVFLKVIMIVVSVLTVFMLGALAVIHMQYKTPNPMLVREERFLALTTCGLILSTWSMEFLLYMEEIRLYPLAVLGQSATAFLIFGRLKRRIMYPAFSMNHSLRDLVARFDIWFMRISFPVMILNATFTCIGALLGRKDLYNLGETMQLSMLSLLALIALVEIKWVSRELSKLVSDTVAHTPEIQPVVESVARRKMRTARAAVNRMSRRATPLIASCVGSFIICVVSYMVGTIPFVNIWVCVMIISSELMFTWWHKIQFWTVSPPVDETTVTDSKTHSALAPSKEIVPEVM